MGAQHAYRVIDLRRSQVPSFEIFQEAALIDFITKENPASPPQLDGVSILDVPVVTLEKALKELELSPEARTQITEDIAWAKERGDMVVLYDCF